MTTSLDDVAAAVEAWRASGLTIVFTNGVFDLLHPGHVRYLTAARGEGDVLVVGVNSDVSVRAIKGPSRPIIPDHERAEILAALGSVDAVVIFDESTPAETIRRVRPDVLVKGADWPADQIVGRETVERRGGRVVRVPVSAGYSTTAILMRMRGQVEEGSDPRANIEGSGFRNTSSS
jgi:D-beta-D-heptose 7-phosphate kinase/D-beta-D-heptose 1-phosphate adenosyltransferase